MITNYWMSPETTSINRLSMLNIEHVEKISLDGTWRFQLLRTPTERIGKSWSSIPVPGLWTMQPPFVPAENPHGVYERDFDLPDSWVGKRLVLQLGGYESIALVYINGIEVGLTKDSRLAAEFDVTKFVKRGNNVIRIDVTKWSDATFIEDHDQWRHGGITRSVKLYATSKVYIERFYTTAGLEKDGTTGTLDIRAQISSIDNVPADGYTLSVRIEELPTVKSAQMSKIVRRFSTPISTDFNEVVKSNPAGAIHFETKVSRIKAWSAENPYLYTLHIELSDPSGAVIEISSQRIGFRSVKIIDRDLLFNGKPVVFYGINRHDSNLYTGRVLTRDDMREELLELKRWNFNAVRTSHYPNDVTFLDLCDELGFYVIGEANIDSHPFFSSIGNDPKYLTTFVDRVSRMIQRDIHHPAVVLWSLGNESSAGTNHEAAAAYARAFDPTRPLQYECGTRGNWTGNHSLTDVVCPIYPTTSAIREYAKPAMHEFKAIAAPAIISTLKAASGNFKIFNKNFFKDLSEYEVLWSITHDGIICESGKVKLPKVAPRKTLSFTVASKLLAKADGTGERFINFTILRVARTPWSSAISEVGWNQFGLPSRSLTVKAAKQSELFTNVIDEFGQIVMPYGAVAPVLSLWRAPTENDRFGQIASKWERWGLRDLDRTDCVVSQTATSVKISNIWQTSTGIKIKHLQIITPVANGFRVKESVVLPKALVDVARVGTNLELDGSLSDLTWFGSGPHETYPDRKTARTHRYVSTVAGQYVPNLRPQENGGHFGVRWFELTNAAGHGVRIQMSKPLQVSVTPNRAIDLADVTNEVEVKACGNAVVHLDAAHRGVGTAVCSPDILPKYMIKPGAHTWEWIVTSIPN